MSDTYQLDAMHSFTHIWRAAQITVLAMSTKPPLPEMNRQLELQPRMRFRMNSLTAFILRVVRSLLRAFWEIDRSRRIKLSRAMYFQIPSLDVTLFSGLLDDTQSMRLTLSETAEIFGSIGEAFESKEVKSVKVGELKWTTDARGGSVVFDITGPLGFRRVSVSREEVAAALKDFEKKVISKLTTTNADQNSGQT